MKCRNMKKPKYKTFLVTKSNKTSLIIVSLALEHCALDALFK